MGIFIAYRIFKFCGTKLNLCSNMVQNNCTRNISLVAKSFQNRSKCVNKCQLRFSHKGSHKQVYDHYFEFFRKNDEYKTTVVHINKILEHAEITSGKYSVVFDGKIWTPDMLSAYLPQNKGRMVKLSTSEIQHILSLMLIAGSQFKRNTAMIKWLDEQCVLRANSWSIDFTLYILDAWYLIFGSKIFKHSYFMDLTHIWKRKLKYCTKNNVIQMLYFVGLAKCAPQTLLSALENKLESLISEVSDVEWAIVCISYFKSNTKLNSSVLLTNICKVAINFIEKNEKFHLISLLKCLRHAQHHNEFLLEKLKKYIIQEYSSLNFVECTHFLATFASVNYYDQHLFKCFEKQGINCLAREEKTSNVPVMNLTLHPSVRNRAKDVARFIWGLLSMGHSCEAHSVQTILRVLYQKFSIQEFHEEPHYLIDSLQSLVFIECYPHELLKKVLTPDFFQKCCRLKRDKPLYQFCFLSTSVVIECPDLNHDYLLKNELHDCWKYFPRSLYKDVKEREGLEEIISLLKQYFNGNDDNFKCCYVFPHIAIAGILVKSVIKKDIFYPIGHEKRNLSLNACQTLGEINVSNGLVHAFKGGNPNVENRSLIDDTFVNRQKENSQTRICIEVLDSTVCIRNSVEPLGLMKTKIRQLRRLSYHVVTLTVPEIRKISNLSSSEKAVHMSLLLNI